MRATVNSENRWIRALTAPAITLRCQLNMNMNMNIGHPFSSRKCVFMWLKWKQFRSSHAYTQSPFSQWESVSMELNFRLNCGHWKKFVLDFNVFNRFYHFIRNLEIVSEYVKSKEMKKKQQKNSWNSGRTVGKTCSFHKQMTTCVWMHFSLIAIRSTVFSNVRLLKILVSIEW